MGKGKETEKPGDRTIEKSTKKSGEKATTSRQQNVSTETYRTKKKKWSLSIECEQ